MTHEEEIAALHQMVNEKREAWDDACARIEELEAQAARDQNWLERWQSHAAEETVHCLQLQSLIDLLLTQCFPGYQLDADQVRKILSGPTS